VFWPVSSVISKRVYRQTSQTCCPWNVRFAEALAEDSPFQPREALAGKDARALAREILAMDVDAYRAAFKGSPMKRAKLPAMKRNAAVVLGNAGTSEDIGVLTRAIDDEAPWSARTPPGHSPRSATDLDDDCPSAWPPIAVPCRRGCAQPGVTV
jgi:epoxyqueuosine reductase